MRSVEEIVGKKISIVDFIYLTFCDKEGFGCDSKKKIKKLIEQNGIRIDGELVNIKDFMIFTDDKETYYKVRHLNEN